MSLLLRTDVTAVKLHEKYILAGIGSTANIYSKENIKLLDRLCCLNGQKIYGFVVHSNRVSFVVFGGKQFAVILIENSKSGEVKLSKIFGPIVCDDWLHSAAWINDYQVALLTAHNTTQTWDISKKRKVSHYESPENSILYSGLLVPLQDDVLVLAGTVFSEIIIHTTKDDKPLHQIRGHMGVIFSITVSLEKGIIVSTSDDRSIRIWQVESIEKPKSQIFTISYWKSAVITRKYNLYGHAARVMRSCITDHFIISIGEDSAACFWSFEGKLLKKTVTHQNASIWSIDANESHFVTGGGDSAVILHPLTLPEDYCRDEIINFDNTPKKIIFTARRNIVILDDKSDLVFYNVCDQTKSVYKLDHKSTYKLLSASNCKQLIAVADMSGKLDIFAEKCKDKAVLIKLVDVTLNLSKILSMHWAGNRHLVFCTDNGSITVVSSHTLDVDINIYTDFILPVCKERWLTACAINNENSLIVVGDRCGNVHIFRRGSKDPIKTFSKVHGRYGPTSITIKSNYFITTGRDGTIKYFSLKTQDKSPVKFLCSKDFDFQWIEKFLNTKEDVICGFKERTFAVHDVKNNSNLIEVPCGGGHRSWDVIRYYEKIDDNFEEFINFVYLKNSDVHSIKFRMSKINNGYIINGSHSKEINCLKSFGTNLDKDISYFITGGEDTTLRISTINAKLEYQDEMVFKHLSNIRTLKTLNYDGGILVVSAGGRAQICIKFIKIHRQDEVLKVYTQELVDFLVKGTDKERKYAKNHTWRDSVIDFDPETRIMDMEVMNGDDGKVLVVAACSDAYVRTYEYSDEVLQPIAEVKHHKTCILRTHCVNIQDKNILLTCTTKGEVSLWDLSKAFDLFEPFFTTTANKCGINSVDTRVLSENLLLIGSGGDDNAINLLIVSFDGNSTILKHKYVLDNYHCAQVTGLKFVDDFMVTTSIDQRVTLLKWGVNDGKVGCEFVTQLYSDVADIQGLEILGNCRDSIKVCVFGKGMEILMVPTHTVS